MRIAIFDSGAGGLSFLKLVQKTLANQDFIYFADTDHVPYGEKSPQLVKEYILEASNFLFQQRIDALVVACNTATSLMIEELRERYQIPIFGMEPALKLAVDQLKKTNKKILVTGTAITIENQRLAKLINQFKDQATIDTVALNQLVAWVESENLASGLIQNYLDQKINQAKQYDAVVLGCTHFCFLKKEFASFFGSDTLIVDGNLGTLNNLIQQLALEQIPQHHSAGTVEFYFSAQKNTLLEKKYRRLLGRLP